MAKRANTRNTSQRHGDEFQYMMMVSRMFSGAMNLSRTGREAVDIEPACDPRHGIATSVKTSGGDWIGLADAERFARTDRPWRLLFSRWTQETDRIKAYAEIEELIIPLSVTKKLLGWITPEIVLEWHNDIASFVAGPAGASAARARAKEIKKAFAAYGSMLRLDYKIDDKDQRRLQFSVKFSDIVALIEKLDDQQYGRGRNRQDYRVTHRGEFHQYPLPIRLISPPRVIDRDETEEEAEAGILYEDAPVVHRATLEDVLGGPSDGGSLRRAAPIRMEERQRQRRQVADTRQARLFG